MDRYQMMDEQELLQRQEEERKKNALLEMMRSGSPGKLPVRKAPYQPMTLMDQLRQAYEGMTQDPRQQSSVWGVRG